MSGHQAYRYVRYDRPLAEKRAERASGGLPGCGPTSQTSVTLRVDTVYPPESATESGSRQRPSQALWPPESPHAAPSTLRRHGCPQLATLDEPGTPDAPWARSQIIRPAASRCLGGAGSSDLGASRLRGPARREVVSRALREPSRPRSRARAPIPTPLSISQRRRSAQQPQQRQATRT